MDEAVDAELVALHAEVAVDEALDVDEAVDAAGDGDGALVPEAVLALGLVEEGPVAAFLLACFALLLHTRLQLAFPLLLLGCCSTSHVHDVIPRATLLLHVHLRAPLSTSACMILLRHSSLLACVLHLVLPMAVYHRLACCYSVLVSDFFTLLLHLVLSLVYASSFLYFFAASTKSVDVLCYHVMRVHHTFVRRPFLRS